MPIDLLGWLQEQCAEYEFDVVALYRTRGDYAWPLTAHDENELELKLEDGAHFLPLPKEPAALRTSSRCRSSTTSSGELRARPDFRWRASAASP